MRHPIKCLLGLLLAIIFFSAGISSCKKDKSNQPEESKTELSTTVDGNSFVIAESSIAASRFEDVGDAKKAIEINAALDNDGSQMSFFISDLKDGTIQLAPKLGTSTALKQKDDNTIKEVITQNYIRFTSGGNVYYAIRGSVIVKLSGDQLTYTWDITFKDASGREFPSKGSFTITVTNYTVKPKSEVKDPTPASTKPTVENISPARGVAEGEVMISGTNFSTVTTENIVKFNNVAATVKSATATKLVVTAPATGTTGAITVKVKANETITGPVFTYMLQPTFTSLTPAIGKVGDTVKISGTNFNTKLSENQVLFATSTSTTVKGVIVLASATSLYVKVPADAVTGPLKVMVNGITATAATGVNTIFTLRPPGSAYTAFTVLSGTAEFSLLYGSNDQIKVLYVDKKQSILYYSVGSSTDTYGNGLKKIDLNTGVSTTFNTDTRLVKISSINSDTNGNVYVTCDKGLNTVTSKFKVSIFKISFNGTTVTPVMEEVDNTIDGVVYFQVNTGGSLFLSNKKFETGGLSTTNTNYGQIPCTSTTSYGLNFVSPNLGFKSYNMDLGTSETLTLNLQTIFSADDVNLNTSSLKEYKYAFDNESNFFGFYETNQTHTVNSVSAKIFTIRKAKTGVTGSTLISRFANLQSTAYPNNGIFAGVLRTMDVDAKGKIYVVNNKTDIVKISY